MQLILCLLKHVRKTWPEKFLSLASENTGFHHCIKCNKIDSIDGGFCQSSSILDNKKAADEDNSYSFPVGPISLAGDDLSCFDHNRVDKVANDLSYCSWSEIGKLEDVDMMFSGCDSTFGLGAGNEDDLGWLSSSDDIEAYGDGLRSDKLLQPTRSAHENSSSGREVSRTNETVNSVGESGTKNQPVTYNGNLQPSKKCESANLTNLSFVNGSSNSEPSLSPQEIINMNKKYANTQNQKQGMGRGVYLESGDVLHNIGGHSEKRKPSTEATRCKVNTIASNIQRQIEADGPKNGYFCSSISCMSDFSCSDQTSLHPTSCIIKPRSNGFISVSPEGYPSNVVKSMQSSPDPPFQMAPVTITEKKMEKLHHSGKSDDNSDERSISKRIPEELDSSVVPHGTYLGSELDEIAEEAACFHQLQRVMERLDVKTKLCIRDGLYRLARNAEQRHGEAIVGNGTEGDRATGESLISERTNKWRGYMDMERETNPIDRSIAHLLFLSSPGASVTSTHGSSA